MKAKIPLFLALITILPSLQSAPDAVSAADFDKALIMEGPSAERELVSHTDVIARLERLEEEIKFLDQQVVSISEQLFDKYGLYIIRPGDTLGRISTNHEIMIRDLLELNEGLDPRHLEVGKIVKIKE